MSHKGIIISLEAFIALMVAATAFMAVSFRSSMSFGYGFSSISSSYHTIGSELSEQRMLYEQYASNLNLSSFGSLASNEGYVLQKFYNFSGVEGSGRMVAIGGRIYVVTPR